MAHDSFEYLGPYQVERVIGRGGMGSVYKAAHSKTGQQVAVKVIASGISNQPRFRRRFAVEIEALKRLKHPNIVSLIGYGEEQGMLFYVMEYVAGQSLHELLRTRRQLDWPDVVHVGIETCAALKHAHNIGIIHRDLKPANLMLDTNGSIKLTDFGIAKLFGSTDETAAGSVIGTADYMPPEQAEGKMVTARSDLYSLGCVLFALLAGRPPFIGKSLPEVLYAVRYSSVPDLSQYADQAPVELTELIHHLLSKDPQKRPPTALVVSNRLKSVQQALKAKPKLTGGNPAAACAPPTQQFDIGKQLTSLDMRDDQVSAPEPTGCTQHPAQSPDTGQQGNTHEQQTLVASENPGESVPASLSVPSSPHDQRENSSLRRPTADSETGLHVTGTLSSASAAANSSNHYVPVTDADRTDYTITSTHTAHAGGWDWVQVLSIVGIVSILAVSIGTGIWMLQPPSAEQLYRDILLAAESGDESLLLGAQDQVNEFLSRHPNDSRSSEIQAIRDEIELSRQVKILQRKASRADGVQKLSAAEIGFLDCMLARSRDAVLGQEKLAAFINLFQKGQASQREQRLVELATFALNAQTPIPVQKDPLAVTQLQEMIDSAQKTLSGEQLQAYYRDLRSLFDGNPWASEVISRLPQPQAEQSVQ